MLFTTVFVFCEETGAERGPCGCATFATGAERGPCGCAVLIIVVVVDVVVLLIFVELEELEVLDEFEVLFDDDEEFPVVLTTSGPKVPAANAGVVAKMEIANRAIGKSTTYFLSITCLGLLAVRKRFLKLFGAITHLDECCQTLCRLCF